VTLRQVAAQALAEIGSPGAMRALETALDDDDRDVRVTAVKAMGARGHRAGLPKIEAMVKGKAVREADLTEKMAFFEAYGAMAGPAGVPVLEKLLMQRGLLGRREIGETRACAAMALGKTRSVEARVVLERALQDRDALVRNAASQAIRETAAR
jgi:HEAT repeat protein